MTIDDPDTTKGRSDLLTLETRRTGHIPIWGLIVIALLLAFPMTYPVAQGKANDLSSWIISLVMTLFVTELPYFAVLSISSYRRAIFSSAGVECQTVYRLWKTQTKRFKWDEINGVVCIRIPNDEGPDELQIELRLACGNQEKLIRVPYSEKIIESVKRVCKESTVTKR